VALKTVARTSNSLKPSPLLCNCETQEEVDEFWEKLSEGGEKSRCGWLKDKFGLSWQIVPTVLIELYQDKDAEKT